MSQMRICIRQLNDPKDSTRDKGFKRLCHLKSIEKLARSDKLLLCEGIFRFLWLSDQKNYSSYLGSLSHFLVVSSLENTSPEESLLFSFIVTVMKNWSSIDKYRLNKFYHLADEMVKVCFDSERTAKLLITCLNQSIFNIEEFKNDSVGIRIHFARSLLAHSKKFNNFLLADMSLIRFITILPSNEVAVDSCEHIGSLMAKTSNVEYSSEILSAVKNALNQPGISSKSRSLLSSMLMS
jgi:hypothetical protein